MSCIYKYKGMELTEEALIRQLSLDPNIVEPYLSQEERGTDDYVKEEQDVFNEKIEHLQKSINAEVILDETVESSRVLGKNDPRTKLAGKPVILVNPNQLFKTTAIHEFGHIFIDSFPGGLDNLRLQRALKQLKGTPLEAEVKALYPDLSEKMLQKEIIVTAIGREGSKIWDNGQDLSAWESFMAWFSDFIKRTLGLERNEIVALSKELLSDKVKETSIANLENQAQEMRAPVFNSVFSKKKEDSTKEEIKFDNIHERLEATYNRLTGVVKKIYKSQEKKGDKAKAQESALVNQGVKTRLSAIKELQKTLTAYEDADKMLSFSSYMQWAREELWRTKNGIDKRLNPKDKDGNPIEVSYDAEYIDKLINWNSSFSVMKEVQELFNEIKKDEHNLFSKEEIKTIEAVIDQSNAMRAEIESNIVLMSRKIYVDLLMKHDNNFDERVKYQYSQDWKELEDAGGSGMTEGEYIIAQSQQDLEKNEAEKRYIAEKLSEKAIGSMSTFVMGMLSEKDMKSEDIGLLSTLLDSSSRKIENFNNAEATEWSQRNKDFRDGGNDMNSRNMKKKYKHMITTSSSGRNYYTGEYHPDFLEKLNEIKSRIYDSEKAEEAYGDIEILKIETVKHPEKEDEVQYTYKSKVPNKDGKEVERVIQFKGSFGLEVKGAEFLEKGERAQHVVFNSQYDGELKISFNEAIARSEAYHWEEANTVTESYISPSGEEVRSTSPIDIWKSKEFIELQKDPKREEELRWLKYQNSQANKRYDNNSSLESWAGGANFMLLPGVMKKTASRVIEGQGLKDIGKDLYDRMTVTQADEFDNESKAQYTNFGEGEVLRIPISYRSKLDSKEQSFDLHTIGLMNSMMSKNYEEKRKIESSIITIKEVMKNKQYPELDSRGNQNIDPQTNDPMWITGNKSSQEYRKAESMVENRLYGITSKKGRAFKVRDRVVESDAVVKTGLKWFGSVALVFNYANSIVNAGTGTISGIIEAIGGDVYNLKDYLAAQKMYNLDMVNILKDFGASVSTSTTNLLLNEFNVMGPEYLKNNFEKGTRAEAMMNQNSLRPLANMGEHMMQSKVMYAILNSIKVQNDSGAWIDKKGNPVKSKKEAASLADMISFTVNDKTGRRTMKLHPSVMNTSFSTAVGSQEKILLETRNLIRAKVDELHGQYTSDIQAHSQRYALGKLAFFLRKWMIPGILRRWRGSNNLFKGISSELKEADEFYSRDQKNYLEGYYVTSFRFLSQIINNLKQDGVTISKTWKSLTPKQKAGIRKTGADLSLLSLIMVAFGALDGEEDDDDKIFLMYLLRRQQSEISFFWNPIEAIKIAQTPTAAMGNIKQIIRTVSYLMPQNWGEVYQQGYYKYQRKDLRALGRLVPRFKNLEDFRQGLKFMNSTVGQ